MTYICPVHGPPLEEIWTKPIPERRNADAPAVLDDQGREIRAEIPGKIVQWAEPARKIQDARTCDPNNPCPCPTHTTPDAGCKLCHQDYDWDQISPGQTVLDVPSARITRKATP